MGGPGAQFRRRRSRRLAEAALALIYSGAVIAAPTPVVSLNSMLASPPTSGYVPDTESSGTPIGTFDASEYAGEVGDESTLKALSRDGFAGGFGASWTEQSSGRALAELVVAFAGGDGARSWLGTAKAAAQASTYYQGSITAFGVGPYYGVRYTDPKGPTYAQVVSFVKGNDFFTVGFISNADDLGNSAALQAKKQFDFAPADSIPPSQWPEKLRLLAGGKDALKLGAIAAVTLVVIGFLFSFGLFVYVRRQGSAAVDAKLSVDGKGQPSDG